MSSSCLYKTPVIAIQGSLLSAISLLLLGLGLRNREASNTPPAHYDTAFLNRTSFPAGFIFGTASSSYQYEGAAHYGGRGLSIWDNYTHRYPGLTLSIFPLLSKEVCLLTSTMFNSRKVSDIYQIF